MNEKGEEDEHSITKNGLSYFDMVRRANIEYMRQLETEDDNDVILVEKPEQSRAIRECRQKGRKCKSSGAQNEAKRRPRRKTKQSNDIIVIDSPSPPPTKKGQGKKCTANNVPNFDQSSTNTNSKVNCSEAIELSEDDDFIPNKLLKNEDAKEIESLHIFIQCEQKLLRFEQNHNETFHRLFFFLSEKLSHPVDKLEVLIKDNSDSLLPSDTPEKHYLKDYIMLLCKKSPIVIYSFNQEEQLLGNTDPSQIISLCLKSKNDKRPQIFKADKNAPLQQLIESYALKNNLTPSNIKFAEDGDIINPLSTAADLGFDDGYQIDVIIKS